MGHRRWSGGRRGLGPRLALEGNQIVGLGGREREREGWWFGFFLGLLQSLPLVGLVWLDVYFGLKILFRRARGMELRAAASKYFGTMRGTELYDFGEPARDGTGGTEISRRARDRSTRARVVCWVGWIFGFV